MSNIILSVPVEIREYIFDYCYRCDLINFACCSKDNYTAVEYLVWAVVDIEWKYTERRRIPLKKLQLLETYTRELIFYIGCDDDDDWHVDGEWRNVGRNYRQILSYCSSEKVRKLTIADGYMGDGGIQLTCSMLTRLTEFTCAYCNEISSYAWKELQQLQHLKKLRLIGSAISNNSMKNISQIQTLEELHLKEYEIEEEWMEHISSLPRLQKLCLDSDSGILDSVIRPLSKLANLEELTLGHTDVDRYGLLSIAVMLTSLKKLDINSCSGLTSAGLLCLCQSSTLTEIDLSATENNNRFHKDAIALFCHVKKMQLKHSTDPSCLVLTRDERYWRADDEGGISYDSIAALLKNIAKEILEEFADLCAAFYLYLCQQDN